MSPTSTALTPFLQQRENTVVTAPAVIAEAVAGAPEAADRAVVADAAVAAEVTVADMVVMAATVADGTNFRLGGKLCRTSGHLS